MSITSRVLNVTAGLGLMAAATMSATSAQAGFSFSTDFIGTDEASIKNSDAELSTRAYGFTASSEFVTFGFQRTDYDFSNLGDSDPFDSLNKMYVDLHYQGFVNNNLYYMAGLNLGALYESDLSLGDSYNISPRLAFGYNFKSGMVAFVGAYANFNGAENVYLPILGLKLGEDKEKGWSGAIAYPATFVQYRFNPQWAVNCSFMTVRDTYHIDDDASKGDWSDGYFREESYGAGVGFNFTPFQHIRLGAGVFSYFDRNFTVYNSSGNEIEEFEVDNAAGAYVRAKLLF